MIPKFDVKLPPDGYAWWYLDAISDDKRYGLTLIAFIGSVFSPYYAWARKRGPADPADFCAINLALYGPGGRWCMTERGRSALQHDATQMRVGPSGLHWDGKSLKIDIDEMGVPLPRPLRGRIQVQPTISNEQTIKLDSKGRHRWTPIWPAARIEMEFDKPGLKWSGEAYFDHNTGIEPLERCFDRWTWSRAMTEDGPVILYDPLELSGERSSHALHFDRSGKLNRLDSPSEVILPRTGWRIDRPTRSEDGQASVLTTWEDTPFYARSLIQTRLLDQPVKAVHESLNLKRFESTVVQLMLPFRMPRRAG